MVHRKARKKRRPVKPPFVDRLINVSKAYIPNLGPLVPLLHVEKFGGGGGGWVGGV